MGCVLGLPTPSDLKLDWVTEYTELSHDQVKKQNKTGKNFTKWDFGNKNSVHQMSNPKRIRFES